MGNGSSSSSSSSNQKNRNNHASINDESDRYLALNFQYIDQNKFILIEGRVRFLATATISAVAEEFIELHEQNCISPDKIILISICLDGWSCPAPAEAARMTLQGLEIKNRSLLCFEPISTRDRPKFSRLTLFSPYDTQKTVYEWDEKSAILKTLLEHVIKVFDLYSTKRDNIQLCTFLNENLNRSHNLGKKFSELGLSSYHSIFVTITKPTSYHKYDRDIYVRVESSSHGEILLYASSMNTITELENQITRRFSHSCSVDITLSDEKYNDLDKTNPQRTLRELGIMTGDTMNAIVRDNLPNKQTTGMNRGTNKSRPMTSPCVVFVQYTFPNHESTTIQVSVTDTLAEVTLQIAAHINNQSMDKIHLYSESVYIDNERSHQRLADFGVKPGSTIYASMANINADTTPRSSRKYPIDSKPLGLINLGNTCFMNSALQCLIHVTPLTRFFLDGFIRMHTNGDNHDDRNSVDTCGEVTNAYAELIWNMRRVDRKNSDYVNSFKPTRMKETIGCVAPHFATSDQQDAQEFMTFLLDAINNELQEKNKPDRNTIIHQLFFGTMQSRITCLKCNHIQTTTNEINFLPLSLNRKERIFTVNFLTKNDTQNSTVVSVPASGRVGNLVQTFLEIRYFSQLFNYIIVITAKSGEQLKFDMPLKNLSEHEVTLIEQEEYIDRIRPDRFDMESDNLKLEECLQEFVSLERLDDLWFCQQGKCKQNTYANKQLQFISLPHVLIIQLKRFSYVDGWRQKLDTFVDYPTNGLNLSNLLTSSSSEKEPVYDLIAVSNHIGSISSGHYTAYARQAPNIDKWYKFDDSYVSTVNFQSEIVSRDAYLLFYIKRNKSI